MNHLKKFLLSTIIILGFITVGNTQTIRYVQVFSGAGLQNNNTTPANVNKFAVVSNFDFANQQTSLPPGWLCTWALWVCTIKIQTPFGGTATNQQILDGFKTIFVAHGGNLTPGASYSTVIAGDTYIIVPFLRNTN